MGNAITNRKNNAHFLKLDICIDILKLAQEYTTYFTGFYIVGHLILIFIKLVLV
ncbi:unknown [Prevotella sp. CAG:5226]|nr:unknown [Prevotella sp. CAG:5226]